MSDKERYKSDQNDENNDSSSTTTTTVNSNRANSSINNPDTNQQQQQSIQNKQKKKVTSLPKSSMERRFEIKHLSDDHDFDDDFNDDYDSGAILRQSVRIDDLDARGIIEYFDDSELHPVSPKNMLAGFNSQILDKTNLGNDSCEFREDNDTKIEPKFNRISSLNEKKSSSKQISPIMLLRRESMRRSTNRAKSEVKRAAKSDSFKIKAEKSDDNSEPDEPESDNEIKKDIKNKKQRLLSADQLYNKRVAKQKEKEIEDAYQKKIKILSKKQIQEQQQLHQYPHPTQQQRNLQQQKLTLMFTPENERHNLYNRSLSLSNNLQTTSGYIIDPNEEFDLWGRILIVLSYFFFIFSFPFSLCTCLKVAQEYERAVVFRLGRILKSGEKGPGIFFVLPCIDTYTKVDLRTVTFDVPPQEILTRDSVTVSVDAVVYFRIFNAVVSVINIEDAPKSTKLLAASTLRNILGTKSLHEILSDRESVAMLIQSSLDETTEPCAKFNFELQGVKVERVEVKDVRLPVQLQRAMATEAEAAREARAKVIAAEGEQKASKALKEAADVISESSLAIQLRYLQTLTQIASEKNSTIVFPIPLEIISSIVKKSTNHHQKSLL